MQAGTAAYGAKQQGEAAKAAARSNREIADIQAKIEMEKLKLQRQAAAGFGSAPAGGGMNWPVIAGIGVVGLLGVYFLARGR